MKKIISIASLLLAAILSAQTQAAFANRLGHTCKSRAFLRYCNCAGIVGVNYRIYVLQKIYCIEIFASAVFVRYPVVAREIEVEHGGDRVEPQSVYMEAIQPCERASKQEVCDLLAPVVKTKRPPVGVRPEPRVFVFVQARPVKSRKRKCVAREVRRHPVHYYAYPVLVEDIDHLHKFARASISVRGRVKTRHLVPPRPVERILGKRHKFHMRKVHLHAIFRKLASDFSIGKRPKTVLRNSFPRAQMNLIDGDRFFCPVGFPAVFYPFFVRPPVPGNVANDRAVVRRRLEPHGVRVRL